MSEHLSGGLRKLLERKRHEPEEEQGAAKLAEEIRALRREVRLLRSSPAEGTSTLTVEEVQSVLGCSRATVNDLLARGKLHRARKIGKRTRVTRASVEALQERVEPGEAAPARPSRTAAQVQAEVLGC